MRCPYCNRWGFNFILKLNEHNMCRYCKIIKISEYNNLINKIISNCIDINFSYDVEDINIKIHNQKTSIENLRNQFINKGYKINFNINLLYKNLDLISEMSLNQEKFLLERLNLLEKGKTLVKIDEMFGRLNKISSIFLEKHNTYLFLINYYYKMRKDSDYNVEKTVEYCIKDIQLIENNLKIMKEIIQNNYNIRSFSQLIIIYTSRKQYDKAIEICDKALKYKIPQTKVNYGYYGRKIKILKLKEKQSTY